MVPLAVAEQRLRRRMRRVRREYVRAENVSEGEEDSLAVRSRVWSRREGHRYAKARRDTPLTDVRNVGSLDREQGTYPGDAGVVGSRMPRLKPS
jgi:hypothetical protein